MSKFKIGDVVVLKSGGLEMTVTKKAKFAMDIDDDTMIACVWFDNNDEPQEMSFHEDTIELVQ